MKKINITLIVGSILSVMVLDSCGSKQSPGHTYMPDMGKSRTIESYAWRDTAIYTTDIAKKGGNMIYFNAMPVPGTLKRGDLFPYDLPNDVDGYISSASVKNPIVDSLDVAGLGEAGRLYNINCGICHGATAAGNGPLATSGKVGGVANLTLPNYVALSDGTMFHSITYGKGVMGSYASQLSKQQRWEVIKYIRTLQAGKGGKTADSTAAKSAVKPGAAADTTNATVKKIK